MTLMKCPECGNGVSDKARDCIHCGYPIKEYLSEKAKQEALTEMFKCKQCGFQNDVGADYCYECGTRITDYRDSTRAWGNKEENDYTSVPHTICPNCGKKNKAGEFRCNACGHRYTLNDYKVVIPHENNKRSCPRCGGTNYRAFLEEVVICEGKTRAKTKLNLNPLKPFTVFNHIEKVVRKPVTRQVSKFICDDCGKIFQ